MAASSRSMSLQRSRPRAWALAGESRSTLSPEHAATKSPIHACSSCACVRWRASSSGDRMCRSSVAPLRNRMHSSSTSSMYRTADPGRKRTPGCWASCSRMGEGSSPRTS